MGTRLRRFLELIRFSHTIFALPFALLSALLAWQAEERFRILDLLGILLCMVFARSTAMAFNRIVDRDIDAANPRTAQRHIPSGLLSVRAVVAFAIACALGFLGSTVLFTLREPANYWPLYLGPIVLLFLCSYSLTKRFTALCHFWLGASLMLAPLAAWIAIRGIDVNNPADLLTPTLLGGAVFFWVAGFDILYACQDEQFDKKAKLRSIPAAVGTANALRIAAASHAVMIVFLLAVFFVSPMLGIVWLVGIIGVALLLIYEHRLVRPDDLSRVNAAFFTVNGIISIGLFFLGVVQVLVGV